MNAGTISAVVAGVVAIIGALTALVKAFKANDKAEAATVVAHNAHARIDDLTTPKP